MIQSANSLTAPNSPAGRREGGGEGTTVWVPIRSEYRFSTHSVGGSVGSEQCSRTVSHSARTLPSASYAITLPGMSSRLCAPASYFGSIGRPHTCHTTECTTVVTIRNVHLSYNRMCTCHTTECTPVILRNAHLSRTIRNVQLSRGIHRCRAAVRRTACASVASAALPGCFGVAAPRG